MKRSRLITWIPIIGFLYAFYVAVHKDEPNYYDILWGNHFNFFGSAFVNGTFPPIILHILIYGFKG
jgi:hypothetical protein